MYKINEEKKGVELYFDGKPCESVRDSLKASGWRWSRFGGFWYNRDTAENRAFAETFGSGSVLEKVAEDKKPFELTAKNLKKFVNFEKWQAGKWSDIATISRAIKKFLNQAGINCRVRSQSFAGGDSVTVETTDLKFKTEQKLKELFKVFEGGHFDGMEDIYIYRQHSNGYPTTKYFFYNNILSESLKEKCLNWLKSLNWRGGFENNFKDDYVIYHEIIKVFKGDFPADWNCPEFGI